MSSVYSEKDENPQFWFNLKTLKVEIGPKSAATYRVGPFSTEAEAKAALSTLNSRSADWSAEEDSEQN
jgi:hypothetical protein